MKRTLTIIILAVSMTGGAWAQDTLSQRVAPLNNYFYNDWLDTTERCAYAWESEGAQVIAKQFVTKDTMNVYGIAAMMTNIDRFTYLLDSLYYIPFYSTFQEYLDSIFPEDPSLEHCGESLLLYQYQRNGTQTMQQLGDSLPVHYLHTPVTHWIMPNTPLILPEDSFPLPIYERYFERPQTVHDTFFVGYTQGQWGLRKYYDYLIQDTNLALYQFRPALLCFNFVTTPSMVTGFCEDVAFYKQTDYELPPVWVFFRGWQYQTLYIFPIIAPPDTIINPNDTTIIDPNDTTITPIDTTGVGIQQVDMVYRYTTVAPNPARERVTVTSSLGLAHIEAYDERGTRIHDAKASGYKATLDVSAWPRGPYLLRITTPMGTTVKKLLVQ